MPAKWVQRGRYYLYHQSGKLRISKWPLPSGARYHVQELVNDKWTERAKPAPLKADEAKEIAEGICKQKYSSQ